MEEKTIVLAPCDTASKDMRLDRFLFSQFPEYSRSYFQELIDNGLIYVNNKPANKSSYLIRIADQVTVTFKNRQCNLNPIAMDFQVIDQQTDFIIINKPAGLLVHHAASQPETPTLVNGLLYHFSQLKESADQERPGIVHRLDKDTSGLMIVALNDPAHILLSNMFKNRQVQKTYLAVTSKHPAPSGKIDLPVGRHPTERQKMSTKGIESRPALTFYNVLKLYKDTALVAAKIITGRTHQIRVHFAALGHGLIGDEVYGHKSPLINRQALHSWKIAFEYKGKQFCYTCPVPEDFKQLLIALNQENSGSKL